jgi:cyclopropane fatty-acyl-phospholipid synthase-like methyltransferase
MHTFTHRSGAYLFDRTDGEDWIAQHFFTGGVRPSHHLIRQYQDLFELEKEWRWSGTHYQRTALDWLAISIVTAMRSKAFFATSTTTIRTYGCGAGSSTAPERRLRQSFEARFP